MTATDEAAALIAWRRNIEASEDRGDPVSAEELEAYRLARAEVVRAEFGLEVLL